MAVELRIPEVGESITEVQIGSWLKSEGERVERDEALVEIESDKATLELPSPVAGRIEKVLKKTGEVVKVGDLIAMLAEGADGAKAAAAPAMAAARAPAIPAAAATPVAPSPAAPPPAPSAAPPRVMPAAQRALAASGLTAAQVPATGPGGRLLKEDVLTAAARRPGAAPVGPAAPPATPGANEEAVPMSPFRARIAQRLKEAQNTAALLTTFNEVDMSGVIALR